MIVLPTGWPFPGHILSWYHQKLHKSNTNPKCNRIHKTLQCCGKWEKILLFQLTGADSWQAQYFGSVQYFQKSLHPQMSTIIVRASWESLLQHAHCNVIFICLKIPYSKIPLQSTKRRTYKCSISEQGRNNKLYGKWCTLDDKLHKTRANLVIQVTQPKI